MLKKLTRFVKNNILFIIVLFIASVLRFVAIDKYPPSLNWDEVSHGFNAYSLLKTGEDEWGSIFPTIFRAYGDYKLPFYIYLTAISEFLFGVNEFAVRFPSVLSGIFSVFFTYLLVNELFRQRFGEKPAVLASLLVAVEPWSLFLSRGAFEANLALAFFTAGYYFFVKGLKKPKSLILNSIFFGLTVWTYNSYRIFTPIFLIILCLIYRSELLKILKSKRKLFYGFVFLTLVFLIPMFYQLVNPVGQARYSNVTILDEGAIAQINQLRNGGCPRLYCNKLTYFVPRFVTNYLSHISGNFLFFKSGNHYQFSVPGHGVIYPLNIIFFLIGIFALIRERFKNAAVLLFWFFISFIPSSLTREAPHVLRSITVLPTPMIITSIGLYSSYTWFRLKFSKVKSPKAMIIVLIYLAFLMLSVFRYLRIYFTSYTQDYSWAWQYGYKQIVGLVKQKYSGYDKFIITKRYGEPHEFFLFYWPRDPEKYQNDSNLVRFYQSNWYWVDSFDKFYFVNDWQVNESLYGNYTFMLESKDLVQCTPRMYRCLLITSPGNVPDGWKKMETINFLDGKAAFEIYEN